MWLPPAPLNPVNRESLLVVQAWIELFDTTTPDTYRARALDHFLLLDELYKVCRLAEGDPKWLNHVNLICAELKERSHPIWLRKIPPAAQYAFETLSGSIIAKQDDLTRVRKTIDIAKECSGEPIPLLLRCAEELLADNIHAKEAFIQTLGCLATHANRMGLGDEVNNAITQCDLTLPPENVLKAISQVLEPSERKFDCLLAVSGEISDIDSLFSDSGFVRIGLPRVEAHQTGIEWHKEHATQYLISTEITAHTSRLAADMAMSRLETMLNMLTLYANVNDHRISSKMLVDDGESLRAVDLSPGKHYGLFRRKAYKKTTKNRLNNMGLRLDGRVSNIIGAHALGISATDPMAALSHFWTALEAISGSYGSGSIGERVSNVIAPIVAARRIHKIASYLAFSIKETAAISGRQIDYELMPSSTTGHVSREDVLSCLTGSRDNPGITSLFSVCEKNPILCHRINQAWKDLSNPRDVGKSLKRSEQRIKWQMLRIYRARNIFVHKGGNDELVWRLLENAQAYISFVATRIIFHMSQHSQWDIDTAIEFERQKFERMCLAMERSSPNCELKYSDVFPHVSDKSEDVVIWGTGSRFGGYST